MHYFPYLPKNLCFHLSFKFVFVENNYQNIFLSDLAYCCILMYFLNGRLFFRKVMFYMILLLVMTLPRQSHLQNTEYKIQFLLKRNKRLTSSKFYSSGPMDVFRDILKIWKYIILKNKIGKIQKEYICTLYNFPPPPNGTSLECFFYFFN